MKFYKLIIIYLLLSFFVDSFAETKKDYTVLRPDQYHNTVQQSQIKLQLILTQLQNYSETNANARIAFISDQLTDIPYIFSGAMGEGDWQPAFSVYLPGAPHVRQDPVYRLDGLDCQTFVQVVMALFYSNSLVKFEENLLKISYGASGNLGEAVHYYNRNHFVDGDWNPINQKNGFLKDENSQGALLPFSSITSAEVTRNNWFLLQQNNLASNVRVLYDYDGPSMAKRFKNYLTLFHAPKFDYEKVSIAYVPKEKIALKQIDGSYKPNQALLDLIPTPAVVEIVRDVKKWNIGNKNIKDLIGSELNISHMGILYRKTFHFGDLIYPKINCDFDKQSKKTCKVTPIICQQDKCKELMFVHATDAYPNDYYWYQRKDGNYTCAPNAPLKQEQIMCNRVVHQPLYDYLTSFQYGSYTYMNNPSIIGIHIEKIMNQ